MIQQEKKERKKKRTKGENFTPFDKNTILSNANDTVDSYKYPASDESPEMSNSRGGARDGRSVILVDYIR